MKRLLMALIISTALVFTSCSTLNPGNSPTSAEEYFQRYQHILRLAVNVGVVNLLDANPTYGDKLMKMTEVIEQVLEGGNVHDFSTLQALIMDRINWANYEPIERSLVEALLTTVRIELENVLKADCKPEANEADARGLCFEGLPETPEKVRFYVAVVSDWIQEGVGLWRASNSSRAVVPILPPLQ